MNINFNRHLIEINGNIISNSFELVKFIRNNEHIFNTERDIEIFSTCLLLFITREIKSDNRMNYLIGKILDSYYPITTRDDINKIIDNITNNLLSHNFKTRTELEEYIIKHLNSFC